MTCRFYILSAIVVGLTLGCGFGASPDHEDGHEGHDGHEEEGHEEHEEGGEVVKLPPDALEHLDIQVAPAATGQMAGTVSATAVIEHDIRRHATLSPLVEGQLVRLKAILGETVKEGQTIAVMRSVELGEARAAVIEAEALLEVAQTGFDRLEGLERDGVSSKRSLQEAKGALRSAEAAMSSASARLRTYGVKGGTGPDYSLRTPIGGTIIAQEAAVGESKGPGDTLFQVADQSVVWAVGRVYEQDIRSIKVGMPAALTLDSWPERRWSSTVDWVAATLDPETQTLAVRVVLDNADSVLRPGMFGQLTLVPDDGPDDCVLMPVDAIQKVEGLDVVFTPGDEPGEYLRRQVSLGEEHDGFAEVIAGLEAGEPVVILGAFDLMSAATAGSRSSAHNH